MAEVGTYYITIMPEMSSFTGEVNKAMGSSGKESGKSYGTSFGDIVKGSALGTTLGNLASKAGGMIASGFGTGISRLDTINNYPKVMESLGYSTAGADKSIQTIMGHLDGLPSSTQDMVTLTQAISDSTGDLDLATAAALGFNDMMLANGASSAEVATAQGVLNRVLGKGSATVAQWQSLTSVMPAQLGMVARKMLGAQATTEDLHTALEDGTVSWNDFLQAIADLDQSGYIDENGKQLASFEEQARANSKGIGTAIDNVKNRIGAGWASIFDAVGQERISGTIDKMSYGVKNAMTGIAGAIGYVADKISQTSIVDSLGKIGSTVGEFFKNLFTEQDIANIKAFADGFISLVDNALKWIADHGDVVTVALGGILGIVSALVGLSIGTKLAALPGAISAVWTVLAANPFGLIVTLIAGVVIALVTFFTQTETGKKIWEGFCKGVSDLITGLKRDFDSMAKKIKQNFEDNKVQWETFKKNIATWNENIRQNVEEKWNAIKKSVSDNIASAKESLVNNWQESQQKTAEWNEKIRQTAADKWNAISTTIGDKLTSIQTSASDKWNAIKTTIGDKIESIQTTISDKFNAAKTKALEIFDGIKTGITDKIDAAKRAVSDTIENIKNLFDFSWSLPAPQLPHITWDWQDIGGIVSIPTFGIDWYARGGVFDSASIIGIGEAGKEAALPLNRRTYAEIAKGIVSEGAGGVVITGNNFYVREELDIDRIAESLNRKVRRERMGAVA